MKKKLFILILFLFITYYFFPAISNNDMECKISKTKIKIGEKINLTMNIKNQNNLKILWQEFYSSNNDFEIYSKNDSLKNNVYILEIEFTSFKNGEYKNFYFTIPVSTENGELINLTTPKYEIIVEKTLTDTEIETIKGIKDPSSIVLKKEKEQAKIAFKFSFYLKILAIVLGLTIFGVIFYNLIYKLIIKKINKNKKENFDNLSPYEKFIAKHAKIGFSSDEDRKTLEKKLSDLTEILKELIYDEFLLNAPSETSNELIINLRKNNFNSKIIITINTLFGEIDLIKFAKAHVELSRLNYFLNSIKELGNEIHSYFLKINADEEKKKANENIQIG